MINYQDIENARAQAEHQLRLADKAVKEAANLIRGRLRSSGVSNWVLDELKKELKDYNMHTGKWKETK